MTVLNVLGDQKMIANDWEVIERPHTEPLTESRQTPLPIRTREVLSREIGFVTSQDFSANDFEPAQDSILAGIEKGLFPQEDSTHLRGAPASFRALCSTPILPPSDEVAAFQRMNFLKYRANTIRSSLNAERPSLAKLSC